MNIAFYAPMKPPTHPQPSGDRRVARLLMVALEAAGHSVQLASTFRTWEGRGDRARQLRLQVVGRKLAERLVRRLTTQPKQDRPQVWFTYHVYHKAPDWLGPDVSRALAIPYLIAEASYAPKQRNGPWALGHESAAQSIVQADAIISLNQADAKCLNWLRPDTQSSIRLEPFLDAQAYSADRGRQCTRRALATTLGLNDQQPWLVVVAMMRSGDKFASYELLSVALKRLLHRHWQLIVVGDGPAGRQTRALFAPFGAERVKFLGKQDPEAIKTLLLSTDVFVWPAVNEAYGMAMLEAQASGLPVVAVAQGGVKYIVSHGETGLLAGAGDAVQFAAALDELLCDRPRRVAMGAAARRKVLARHDLNYASVSLEKILRQVCP